jgi:hypothetical protein
LIAYVWQNGRRYGVSYVATMSSALGNTPDRVHGSSYFALRPGRCSNREWRGKRVDESIQAWWEEGRDLLYPQFPRDGSSVRSEASKERDPAETFDQLTDAGL